MAKKEKFTFEQLFPGIKKRDVLATAEKVAQEHFPELKWAANVGARTVLSTCLEHRDLFQDAAKQVSIGEYLYNWLSAYANGYEGRASQRKSQQVGTLADEMVTTILSARMENLTESALRAISEAHRLSMAGENVLGALLEEYLAVSLERYGWYCCWGNVVKAADFVSKNNDLLQIKNRSNSENSSSNKIREGKPIQKWHRINAASGKTYWEFLCKATGAEGLSEEGFKHFVIDTVRANPDLVYLDKANPWLSFKKKKD